VINGRFNCGVLSFGISFKAVKPKIAIIIASKYVIFDLITQNGKNHFSIFLRYFMEDIIYYLY
jgi:hypothetical protein